MLTKQGAPRDYRTRQSQVPRAELLVGYGARALAVVAFQGQGGGLPKEEWTLASVLKTAGYQTFFTGKWHLGEADYALPNAQGYDEMKYAGLYHLNAYTYADPTWFPDMSPDCGRCLRR
jgi:arylsulfatase A-like enzyme